MSRHSLLPLPEHGAIYEIAIGWDRPLGSFFVIIFGTPDDDDSAPGGDELTPLLWEGAAPGALITPEAAIAFAAPFALIPDGLAALLAADRQAEGVSADRPAQCSALAALWPKPEGRP